MGVAVGVRKLGVLGTPAGEIVYEAENPKARESNLANLRRLNRQRSRRTKGSRQYNQVNEQITRLHRRVKNIRAHHIHKLNSMLAKTHGTIVVESLGVTRMLQHKGLYGARARRRKHL